MESDPVKQRNQRNRRRERAQRMQQQRQSQSQGQHGHGREGANDAESGDEDNPGQKHQRPPRPQPRRKRKKEPMFEEDLIDGFAIVSFRSYEDLEKAEKYYELHKVLPDPSCNLKHKEDAKESKSKNSICINSNVLSFNKVNYPSAKEKDPEKKRKALNGSSSHLCDGVVDRLSDESSHSSSGRGYICDSETGDDRASDAGSNSDLFLATLKRDPNQVNSCNARPKPSSCSPPALPIHIPSTLSSNTLPEVAISCSATSMPNVSSTNFRNTVPFTSASTKVQISSFANSKSPVNSSHVTNPIVSCTTTNSSRNSFHNLLKPYSNNCPTHTPHTNFTITNHCPEGALPASVGLNLTRDKELMEMKRIQSGSVTSKHSHTNGTDEVKMKCESAKVSSDARLPYVPVSVPEDKSKIPDHTINAHISRNAKLEVKKEPQVKVSVGSVSKSHMISGGKTPPPLPPAITSTHLPVTTTTTSHREVVTTPSVFSGRTHSPRGHSPNRERESFSSNVSSMSRGSVTPSSCIANSMPCSTVSPQSSKHIHHPSISSSAVISSVGSANHLNLNSLSTSTHSLPRPNIHAEYSIHPPSLGHPGLFPSSIHPAAPPNPSQLNPLSNTLPHSLSLPGPSPYVENSIFSHAITRTSGTDLLRRELDSRFLASAQDRLTIPSGPQYLHTEMHHHQHQHTHLHQHSSLLPPIGLTTNPTPSIMPSPLFKDLPKLGGVDSPFYRPSIAAPGYASIPQLLPHQVPGGPSSGGSPFVTSNHLTAFQPKNLSATKARSVKTGRWNAMHVRIAWEISNHQQKQKNDPTVSISNKLQASPSLGLSTDLLRPPGPSASHLFSSMGRSSELSPFPTTILGPAPTAGANNPSATSHRLPFESAHPSSLFSSPASQNLSHFQRYPGGLGMPSGSHYGSLNSLNPNVLGGGRELPNLSSIGSLQSSDSWNRLSLGLPGFQTPWPLKPDLTAANERRERDESRRSSELERERREREHMRLKELEKQKEIERQKDRDRELRSVHRSVGLAETTKNDERDRERLRDISHLTRIDDRVHRKSDHLASGLNNELSNLVKKEEGFHELKPSDPKSSFLLGHPPSELRVKEEPKLVSSNPDMKLYNHGADKDIMRHNSDKHFNKINLLPPHNHIASGNYPDRGQMMSSLGMPGALSGIDPRSAQSTVNSFRTSLPVIDMFRNPFSQAVRPGLESFERDQRERELMHRFGSHSMNVLSLSDRFRDPRSGPSLEPSSRELERHLQLEREKQATLDRCKLGSFPPISSSGVFQSPSPLVSSLNSPYRNLTNSFLSNSLHSSSIPHGIAPPPLIPANQNLGSSIPKLTPPPGRPLDNHLDSKKEQSQSR